MFLFETRLGCTFHLFHFTNKRCLYQVVGEVKNSFVDRITVVIVMVIPIQKFWKTHCTEEEANVPTVLPV